MEMNGTTVIDRPVDIEPSNWLKYLGPIFTWMGRRQNQQDVEKLRDILESTA